MEDFYLYTGSEGVMDKVVRAFYFAWYWLGNLKTSGCLVGRRTCTPAKTRVTPQLVRISMKS